MKKSIGKSILILLIISIAVLTAGLLLAIPISKHYATDYNTVLFIEGITVTLLALCFSVQANTLSLGNRNVQYIENSQIEPTLKGKETADYYQNFSKLSVYNPTLKKLAAVLGGLLLMLCSSI